MQIFKEAFVMLLWTAELARHRLQSMISIRASKIICLSCLTLVMSLGCASNSNETLVEVKQVEPVTDPPRDAHSVNKKDWVPLDAGLGPASTIVGIFAPGVCAVAAAAALSQAAFSEEEGVEFKHRAFLAFLTPFSPISGAILGLFRTIPMLPFGIADTFTGGRFKFSAEYWHGVSISDWCVCELRDKCKQSSADSGPAQ